MRFARQALLRDPQAIPACFILGAGLRRSGDAPGARDVLAPLAARTGAWGVHFEHGMALALLGEAVEAAAALERATAANPQSSLAWHALGDQLALLGRAEEALVAGGIDDPALGAAAALLERDEPAARALLQARFGLDLNDVAAVRLLADVAVRQGRDDAAAALLATTPAYLPAHYHHAALLFRRERPADALAALQPLLDVMPGCGAALALRGAILLQLGREEQAVADFAAAVVFSPDDARLRLAHGHALRSLGRQAEAVQAYRAALDRDPAFAEPWWSLANLKTWRFETDDVARMERTLASDDLAPEQRAHLHFALGKAGEDATDYAASFAHYAAGNAARRSMTPYDADAHSAFVARSIANLDEAFFIKSEGGGFGAPDPIFVLGMPRSGSTLVEQILAGHSRIEGLGELPDITAIARRLAAPGASYPECLHALSDEDFASLGAEYLERTRQRRSLGRPVFVDKFPGNFLHIGLIHRMLPKARIIDVRRDPRACGMSLFKQNFAAGQGYSYDLGDLGRYFVDYDALMRHFDRVMPGRVLHISYEALVAEPEREVRRMLDRLDLAFEPACLTFFESRRAVRTPSSEQVRRPIYRDGLDRWRSFEPWLGPLLAALGPLASPVPDRP